MLGGGLWMRSNVFCYMALQDEIDLFGTSQDDPYDLFGSNTTLKFTAAKVCSVCMPCFEDKCIIGIVIVHTTVRDRYVCCDCCV